jgi:hypothetical protein
VLGNLLKATNWKTVREVKDNIKMDFRKIEDKCNAYRIVLGKLPKATGKP